MTDQANTPADEVKVLARAIFDPGYFLPRLQGEAMWDWQARACIEARQSASTDAMREALEPFAREANEHDRADILDSDSYGGDLTFGDLRRARAALKGTDHAQD